MHARACICYLWGSRKGEAMQFGIFSVSDVTRNPVTGYTPSEAERIQAIVQIARRADEVGLDVFAIGEHHNPPFFASSPTTLLAHIAALTERIILSTAVTLITTNDPVKIAEDYAMLQHLEPAVHDAHAGRPDRRGKPRALREMEVTARVGAVEVAPLAVDVARASVTGVPSAELQAAIEQIAAADAVIAAAPVYKAGISGLFKSFVDVLDNDLLVAKPVVLAATAGSNRHALVVDEQMRSLFAYMRALTLPTSVFAAPEDWGAAELGERVQRASTELAVVIQGQIEQGIADRAWSGYQHEFAGNATRAEQTAADTDFDTPLMRLAAGGRTN